MYSLSLYGTKFKISSILTSISRKCSVVINKVQSVVINKIQQYIQTYLVHCHMYHRIITQNIPAAALSQYTHSYLLLLCLGIFFLLSFPSLFFFSYFFCDPALASPNFFFFFFFLSSICLIATIFIFFG